MQNATGPLSGNWLPLVTSFRIVRGAGLGISSMPWRRITLRNRSTVSFLRRPRAKAWHFSRPLWRWRHPVLQTSFRRFSTAPRRSISVCPVMTCEKSVALRLSDHQADRLSIDGYLVTCPTLYAASSQIRWTSATLRSDCSNTECR